MNQHPTYDVAVIGYGPTGATAANLLGQLGLKVVVIERDPDVYGRARAISTDEEVMRIWQTGRAGRAIERPTCCPIGRCSSWTRAVKPSSN